ENNAFTSSDITNYYLTLPAENMETAFWLESDRMLNLAFTPESLEVQRSVVIEEFKQRYLNQPYGDVWLHLKPLAYTTHPYQWNTIGKSIEHVANANMDDVKGFFKKHYAPNNAIMVVAGNTSLEAVKVMCEKYFEPIPEQNIKVRNLPQEPVQTAKRTLTLERNVPTDTLYKVYHMCDKLHPDYYTTDLISDILSNGKSARLYNALVKDTQLFTDINAYIMGDIDAGLFVVTGKLNKNVTFEEAENAVDKELQKMHQTALEAVELQKVKNKIESTLVFSEMNVLNKAMNLAYAELLGDANNVNKEMEHYAAVTAQDITRVAKTLFTDTNASVLYYKSVLQTN
ncbi:MAG: insulinase family protein, partial [Bacteroidia bacterium]|nr:insulinase family protein [Bacteroidia bacterium]